MPYGGPQYEAMLTRMMETGIPREELHTQVGEAYAGGQLPDRGVAAAEEWLRETHLPGYEEYRSKWEAGGDVPVREATGVECSRR